MSDLELMLADEDEDWAALERRELFRTSDPVELVRNAARVATELAKIVEDKHLYQSISGKKHVKVEGWTLLGNMLRVYPYLVWSRKLEDGWEARVEARTLDGTVVGAAESQCLRGEARWRTRDDYALRSMAQTRATSKALKMPLGFVFSMAGYDTTPAEEMPHEAAEKPAEKPPASQPAGPVTQAQGQEIAGHIAMLEELDPGTDWGAWCREQAGVDSFLTLDADKARGLIAALIEMVVSLSPPHPSEGGE